MPNNVVCHLSACHGRDFEKEMLAEFSCPINEPALPITSMNHDV